MYLCITICLKYIIFVQSVSKYGRVRHLLFGHYEHFARHHMNQASRTLQASYVSFFSVIGRQHKGVLNNMGSGLRFSHLLNPSSTPQQLGQFDRSLLPMLGGGWRTVQEMPEGSCPTTSSSTPYTGLARSLPVTEGPQRQPDHQTDPETRQGGSKTKCLNVLQM